MRLTLYGGPEDGRAIDVDSPPPPELRIAVPSPLTVAELVTDEPIVTGHAHLVHRYRLVHDRPGPIGRARYTYEGTS